ARAQGVRRVRRGAAGHAARRGRAARARGGRRAAADMSSRAEPSWPPRYDPAWRPAPDAEYWAPELECADPKTRDEIVLAKLRAQVQYAWERSAFYRRRWEAAGVAPATLRTLADLARFPVVEKADLRAAQAAAPPFGDYLCLEPREIARIHGSSGTTGRPTVFGVGRDDWERIGEAHARVLWAAGLRPDDRVLIASFFSLYLGSWGALKGCERLGAAVFPFGAGVPGQTLMAVQWARDLRPTAFYGTPSYALHFAETARREGLEPRDFGFRTLFFSGQPRACHWVSTGGSTTCSSCAARTSIRARSRTRCAPSRASAASSG